MVQLVCSCLNIRVHAQESPESLVAGIPSLTPAEQQHPFFVKGAYLVTLGLGGVTEGQKHLVRRYRVGAWTVLECLNCHLLALAIRGVGDVAASTLLISDVNKIQMLQKCEGYSPVFNLVLPTSLDTQPTPPLSPVEYPGSTHTDAALTDIQQQVTRFLKKAQSQVVTNIETYTKQQQTALQALTLRARQDRQILAKLITSMQSALYSQSEDDVLGNFDMEGTTKQQQLGNSMNTQPFSMGGGVSSDYGGYGDDGVATTLSEETEGDIPPLVSLRGRGSGVGGSTQPLSMNNSQTITAGMRNLRLSSAVTVPRGRQQQETGQVAHSLDVEGLFDMEGMTDSGIMYGHHHHHHHHLDDDVDDDSDDSLSGEGGGHHIPGGRQSVRDIAKSVPVNVPMWGPARAKPVPDPQLVERPSDINQMGASIRALARSVHTSSVDLFGDLPRPRQPL